MKSQTYPCYELKVTSWENDADFYNTKSTFHTDKDVILFLLELSKAFRSQHHRLGTEPGFGNVDIPNSKIVERAKNLPNFDKWLADLDEDTLDDEGLGDYLSDEVCNLVGTSEYGSWRVFESAELYYHEKELENLLDSSSNIKE